MKTTQALAQSVQARLVQHAHQLGLEPNLMLTRFGVERFLYRLSKSPHGERFVLKGALLLVVWLGELTRPTRDADLLGVGDLPASELARMFAEACALAVDPDGMTFDAASIQVAAIRPEDAYGGQRVTLVGKLGNARIRVQVDVGLGDAVVPAPLWLDYPSLLKFPHPRLRAYSPEVAVAEKLHAMVVLGSKNSRMRDFFDVDALSRAEVLDLDAVAVAVRNTFARRGTELPMSLPLALTREFAEATDKVAQWKAWRTKTGGKQAPESLIEVVERLAVFFAPVLEAARR